MKTDLVDAKAIRFGPARDGAPVAWPWKLWTHGSEIYTLGQSSVGGAMKISIHASGEIHLRLKPKEKQGMTPLRQVETGPWHHALQIRFLPSDGAKIPKIEQKVLEKKSCCLVDLPQNHILIADILVGAKGTNLTTPLPAFFNGGQILWRRRLADGRFTILSIRVQELDAASKEKTKYIRERLKPTLTLNYAPDASVASSTSYVEIHELDKTNGNLVSVVPMGDEAIHFDRDEWEPLHRDADLRAVRYQSPRSRTEIVAPNGARVATLEIQAVDKEIELAKNYPRRYSVGVLSLRLDTSNLIAGSKFIAAPRSFVCLPDIEGANPRNWEYMVYAQFDGSELSVEVPSKSSSVRNKNLKKAISTLSDTEEIVIAIPFQQMQLFASKSTPEVSTELEGRFTLRDA